MTSDKWAVRPAGGQIEGGTREVGIYKNGPNAAARTRMAWRGEGVNIEKRENRFADSESCRGAGGASAAVP